MAREVTQEIHASGIEQADTSANVNFLHGEEKLGCPGLNLAGGRNAFLKSYYFRIKQYTTVAF